MNFPNNMWFFTFFTHMTLKLDLFKNRFQIPIWQLLADLPCKFESEIPFLTTFLLQKDNFGKKKKGIFLSVFSGFYPRVTLAHARGIFFRIIYSVISPNLHFFIFFFRFAYDIYLRIRW